MLKAIRLEMGYSIAEMAECLGLLKPTYQGYEDRRRPEPEGLHAAMLYYMQLDKAFFVALPVAIDKQIAEKHPHKFLSGTLKKDKELS